MTTTLIAETAVRTADFATVSTSIGPFTTLVDGDGAVLAAGWTADADALRGLVHTSLRPDTLRERDSLGAVTRAVIDYHRGDLTAVDSVPVRQHSGEFLQHAWQVLRAVPAGGPLTYTEFAARAGRPAATRAAANACARNAAALFVPCHRIVRTDGTLGGFRWGLPAKQWLLDHEA
ncbi:methylated-DNA--[protein]-cysteine S-methyltransferase [Nocardia donostiensis]|uniref:Methylated-DNA--protein-cysteine methyltransferase n=1 Tax=Nocardia donostiensis TaxID=1538463 RepID=A0A1W0B3M6_9NOCA|nr:methylated-DNA--[protein]-cysteine S-methyltransferase [Nocardia donostiensis]ONM50630.1 methylated-DNA--protein-cysteine methyltransferase [Nocardia donostiensis]OQS17143.1 methylated-DNA--protein-cysteine methyltransferase [Nocardia donostiensis]OQS18041.1 methylated-DNA--protein-cysteine methyltransferase [Nocardia donostiensis]